MNVSLKQRLFLIAGLISINLTFPATALRSTDIEAYLDPAYTDYQPKKILLVVNGSADLQKEIYKKAKKRIQKKYKVQVFKFNEIFVPTRTWSAEQVDKMLTSMGVDSVLEITSLGYSSEYERVNLGSTTTTTGNASIYGDNLYGSATSNTNYNTATFASDHADMEATLIDRKTGNKVWVANISTSGSGTAMVGAGWTASSVMSNLVKNWKSVGLLQ